MSKYVGPLDPNVVAQFDTIPKFTLDQHNKKNKERRVSWDIYTHLLLFFN